LNLPAFKAILTNSAFAASTPGNKGKYTFFDFNTIQPRSKRQNPRFLAYFSETKTVASALFSVFFGNENLL
jgi:hypothetical protein